MESIKIAEVIGERRKDLGLTQKELADRISVTDKAVSKWECGAGYPDITVLPDLAEALGVSVDELFGKNLPPKSENSENAKAATSNTTEAAVVEKPEPFWISIKKDARTIPYLCLCVLCLFISVFSIIVMNGIDSLTHSQGMLIFFAAICLCATLAPAFLSKNQRVLKTVVAFTFTLPTYLYILSINLPLLWVSDMQFLAISGIILAFIWCCVGISYLLRSKPIIPLAIILALSPLEIYFLGLNAYPYTEKLGYSFICSAALCLPIALGLLIFWLVHSKKQKELLLQQ